MLSRNILIAMALLMLIFITIKAFADIQASNTHVSESIDALMGLQATPLLMHEQLLAKKREQTEVITKHFPDVHPVHFKFL